MERLKGDACGRGNVSEHQGDQQRADRIVPGIALFFIKVLI